MSWLNTSIQTGFARSASEAMFPRLFPDAGWWCPSLNPAFGGTRLWDLSGRQNWGTLTNMEPASDWVVNGGKYALDLDGVDEHVLGATGSGFPVGTQPRTLSIWFSLRADANVEFIGYGGNAAAGHRFALFRETNGSLGAEISNAGATFFWNWNTLWHNLVAVYDGSSASVTAIKVFFDGIERSLSYSGSATINTQSTPITIGAISGATSFYRHNGFLDDGRLYNRALTAGEVRQLYQIGRGNMPLRRRRRYAGQAGGVANPVLFHNHYVNQGFY
jgi:hypothetical protein